MQLYTNPLCPFAHRVRITLAEKGITASRVDIDLRNPPANFIAIAPRRSVPLLRLGDSVLPESTVIAEYLNDAYPEPALLPRDAWERARARLWIRFADERLYAHTWTLLYATDEEERRQSRERIYADLRHLETVALAKATPERPYFLGARFTLVDATFYPWFEQRAVLEKFREFVFPPEFERLLRWETWVASRPAVHAEARPRDFYLREYAALAASADPAQ